MLLFNHEIRTKVPHIESNSNTNYLVSAMDSGSDMAGDPKGSKKKREPGKHCVVMFCNNTNAKNVSWQQWIQFILAKTDDN